MRNYLVLGMIILWWLVLTWCENSTWEDKEILSQYPGASEVCHDNWWLVTVDDEWIPICFLWWRWIELEKMEGHPENDVLVYDQDSWKEIISDDCQTFFDWCNWCSRLEDWEVVCTKMFCDVYDEPRCTDNDAIEETGVVENIDK